MGRLWKVELETGDGILDRDHRDLFGLLDALESASLCGDGPHARGLLGEFLSGCGAHFAREEAIMVELGYAQASARLHRDAHALYLDDLRRFLKSGLPPTSPGFRLYVGSRLTGWFLQHIRSQDFPLAAARQQGAPPPVGPPGR